jgi:hypothetical protein
MIYSGGDPTNQPALQASRSRLPLDDAYEVVGLRDTGDVYAVEVLGQQTQAFAADLAQQWADKWQAPVNLYRVPFVSLGHQWRPEQMELMQQFLPTRQINRRGAA